MSAFFIAQLNIHDPDNYKNYLAGFMPIFERYGGELIITSSKTIELIEGEWDYPSVVVLKFPDLDHARRWHDDPEYMALAAHRHASAQTNMILVEGID